MPQIDDDLLAQVKARELADGLSRYQACVHPDICICDRRVVDEAVLYLRQRSADHG